MVQSFCFVPGCSTGYLSDRKRSKIKGVKVKSLFKSPRDADIFEKWKKAVPQKDKELSHNNFVCELHFREEDIEKYYITKMPDGSVCRIERGKYILKTGSVPSIFLNSPKYLSKMNIKQNLPADQKFPNGNKKANSPSESCRVSPNDGTIDLRSQCPGIMPSLCIKEEEPDYIEANEMTETVTISPNFNFKSLLENCDGIKRPSEMWGETQASEFLIYAKWTADFLPERWVVIRQDLSVNIFLKGSKINVPEYQKVNSVYDVFLLLEFVDKLLLCAGIKLVEYKFQEKCSLYLLKKERSRGNYSRMCEECRKAKIRQADSERKRKKLPN